MDFMLKKINSISTLKEYHGRVLVASNRLPVTLSQVQNPAPGESRWAFKMSSGGLVAGLEGVKKKVPFLWFGWLGTWVPKDDQVEIEEILLRDWNCVPVWISDELGDLHYNGMSNGVLWPLFHYLIEEGGSNFQEKYWTAYLEANRLFANVIEERWQSGDLLWIHDYHLMCLPEFLRQKISNVRCGFFLHIPFPSSEIIQVLPVRKQILTGLLNCDLIGFHTYDYIRHFLSSCARVLGLDVTLSGVNFEGRFIPVSVFPVGIEVDKFVEQLEKPETILKIADYGKLFEGKRVFLGIDRLDYIKGLPLKLKAFEKMLEKYPVWRGKVVLIQVAVPSRIEVEEYRKLKNEVDALVGHINGTYGSLAFNPVHYMFKSIDFAELAALYRISDAIVITSIRDGMNLVAKEYIACQQNKYGLLVLSEFAGSANQMSGALLVNPYDPEQVADAMNEALVMPEEDKAYRFTHLFDFISRHTASHWGQSFIKDLHVASRAADRLDRTPRLSIKLIENSWRKAKKRLIVLFCDGVLISYTKLPFLAHPSRRLKDILASLTSDPKNVIYVISGRDRNTLTQWFGNLPIGLVAEYGFFVKDNVSDKNSQWNSFEFDLSWMKTMKPIFEQYTESTPGSFLEEKETSLTWHYRSTEPNFGSFRGQELLSHLDVTTFPVNVISGEKTIEVRPHECNATSTLKKLMNKNPDADLLLYIGDPTNLDFSEDKNVFNVSVGQKNQKFYLQDVDDVIVTLDKLSNLGNEPISGNQSPKIGSPSLSSIYAMSPRKLKIAQADVPSDSK